MSIVMVAIFGFVFLGEKLAFQNWLGVLFVSVGALLIAYQK